MKEPTYRFFSFSKQTEVILTLCAVAPITESFRDKYPGQPGQGHVPEPDPGLFPNYICILTFSKLQAVNGFAFLLGLRLGFDVGFLAMTTIHAGT